MTHSGKKQIFDVYIPHYIQMFTLYSFYKVNKTYQRFKCLLDTFYAYGKMDIIYFIIYIVPFVPCKHYKC